MRAGATGVGAIYGLTNAEVRVLRAVDFFNLGSTPRA